MKENANQFSTKDKKDLLFLHGYLSSGKSFAYQFPYFSDEFNIFSPDLKGFGENKDMPYPYSLDDYINEVKIYIEKNGLKNPCVIAHSFGGRIAIKLASKEKEIFSKIVLTGSAGLKPKKTLKKRIKKLVFLVLKGFIKKEKLKRFYSKDYQALSPIMQKSFILIVNEHLDDYLDEIAVPTLIINGKNDRETPPYMANRLHKNIKGSKMVMLEDAGHFCFIDRRHKFNTEVKEFLLS